jgi:hypothetical protein
MAVLPSLWSGLPRAPVDFSTMPPDGSQGGHPLKPYTPELVDRIYWLSHIFIKFFSGDKDPPTDGLGGWPLYE